MYCSVLEVEIEISVTWPQQKLLVLTATSWPTSRVPFPFSRAEEYRGHGAMFVREGERWCELAETLHNIPVVYKACGDLYLYVHHSVRLGDTYT